MEAEPIQPTACDHCGKSYNTSRQHPSRYCSIACEEGRRALPISDPSSDGYHLHVQGEPQSLIGREMLAVGLKRTDYSPDWHKSPKQYSPQRIVAHLESDTSLILKDEMYLGTVVDYQDGNYVVEREDIETGTVSVRLIDASIAVSQLRQDRWWVA